MVISSSSLTRHMVFWYIGFEGGLFIQAFFVFQPLWRSIYERGCLIQRHV